MTSLDRSNLLNFIGELKINLDKFGGMFCMYSWEVSAVIGKAPSM